mmetsp:Transcript_26273/g.66269  ORF Transcript_26273/g.66269 Transcript_26273/m.66269 type:complete len:206 (+) Transcript_26273:3922-4539(+)
MQNWGVEQGVRDEAPGARCGVSAGVRRRFARDRETGETGGPDPCEGRGEFEDGQQRAAAARLVGRGVSVCGVLAADGAGGRGQREPRVHGVRTAAEGIPGRRHPLRVQHGRGHGIRHPQPGGVRGQVQDHSVVRVSPARGAGARAVQGLAHRATAGQRAARAADPVRRGRGQVEDQHVPVRRRDDDEAWAGEEPRGARRAARAEV